jgi:hypothetical protein
VEGSFTWEQAKADAESKGGHLATITSQVEWDFVESSLLLQPHSNLWMGGKEVASQWSWITGETWGFTKWWFSEPNAGTNDVLLIPFTNLGAGNNWYDGLPIANEGAFTSGGYILEFGYPTDPTKADTDGDGYDDKVESLAGTDPNDPFVYPGMKQFTYNGFASTGGLTLNGNAQVATTGDGKVLRVTPATTSQSGSFFCSSQISTANFSTVFSFRFTNPHIQGSDGIALVIQRSSLGQLGSGGGYLGYSGISPSVAVEFDTICNGNLNDPVAEHVGVDLNGSLFSQTTANLPSTMKDGGRWWAWVTYFQGTLKVYVLKNESTTEPNRPSEPILSMTLDLKSQLGGNTSAWLGFTGGTGADWMNQDILYWRAAGVVGNPVLLSAGSSGSVATAVMVDSDGDGQSDAMELEAGTDPYNANSRFTLSLTSAAVPPIKTQSTGSGSDATGQQLVLTWPSVPGRWYNIQMSTNLSSWSTIQQIQALGNETTFQVPASEAKAFYRIGIQY